jgi:diguanylate cyclase (GGDEF)-like protein
VISTRVQIEAYLQGAQRLAALAGADPGAAAAQIGAFDQAAVKIQSSLDVLPHQLTVASAQAEQRAATTERAARYEILIIGLFAVLAVAVLALLLSRSTSRSLRQLAATADAITAGDLEARTGITGPNELGSLGRALNAMADGLRGLFARLRDEAGRDAFSSQLAEAFELADTEGDAHGQVELAMQTISGDLPMELLVAESSQARIAQVAANPRAGAPGCPVETPYSCLAVRRGGPVTVESSEALNACPKLRGRPSGPCSATCVPVTFMGRALGVLHATGPEGQAPNPQQIVRLTALAAQAGSTIGTVRATETTELQATTDGLTGLVNRRTLENQLHGLLRDKTPFALAMADLDHFKLVNDTFGHDAGDRALRVFAQVVRDGTRADDVTGRYGGEEFILAFPEQSVSEGHATLERLRGHLAAVQAEVGTPPFTASFGLTESTIADNLADIIRAADTALAVAKREGRDRIVVADEGSEQRGGEPDARHAPVTVLPTATTATA